MNNEELINDFLNHMPDVITKRQKEELLKTVNDAIKNNKEVEIQISENYKVLTAKIKEGNTITTQTIDIKKILPKKKNKFIEWLNS